MADTDPAIATLTRQLAELSAALTRVEERSKKAAEASKEGAERKKQEAAEAEKLSSKLADAARAATGVTEASRTSSSAALTLKTAFANLAREGIAAAVAGLEQWVRQLPEAAARNERHAAAVRQLGSAWEAVQHATNGAVSAEQAAAVQQRVAQSGIQLTARELAAVTQRAREYARATGTDLGQALEQLADNIVDPGEELRKFGVFLRQGIGDGDKLRETLRQLTQQAESGARSQLSLAESMEAANRAHREASDAVAGLIAQKLELADFFTQLTSWLNDAAGATDGWKTATDALAGTLREVAGLQLSAEERARNGQAPNQSASGAFIEQAGPLAQQARRRGLNLSGIELGQFGVRASERQREGALALLRQAGAGGVTQERLDAQIAELMGRANARELGRVGAEQDRTEKAEYLRRREIRRRNQASASPSSSSSQHAERDGFGIGTDGFLTEYLRNGFEMLRARIEAARTPAAPAQVIISPSREIQRRTDRLALQRESAEARQSLDAADDPTTGLFGSQFSRAAGEAEARQRQERVRLLREQSAAIRELIAESERQQDIAMREGRPMAEVNDLVRQRIGLQTALAQNTRELSEIQNQNAISFEEIGAKLQGVLEGMTDAFGEGVVAAIEGSKAFSDSMHEMTYNALRATTKMAVVEVLKNTAMGIAAAATYRYDAAAQHFASAGVWAAVGVASGLGLAAMPNPNAAKPKSPAEGSERSASADRPARADDNRGGGPLILNFNVSGAAFTDAGVQAAASAAVRGAVANGFLTPHDLGGLRG